MQRFLRTISRPVRWGALALAATLFGGRAHAHFIWIHLDPAGSARFQVQFSDGVFDPTPAGFLRPLEGLELRTPGGDRGVFDGAGEGRLDVAAHKLVGEFVYGTMGAEGSAQLLVYHAKGVRTLADAATPSGLRAELLAAPGEGGGLRLTLLFDGRPAPDAQLIVLARDGDEKLELVTDAEGRAEVPPLRSGMLQARARVIESQSGEHEGQAFVEIGHYATLLVSGRPAELPEGGDAFAQQWVERAAALYPGLPGTAVSVEGTLEVHTSSGTRRGTYSYAADGTAQVEVPDLEPHEQVAIVESLQLEGLLAFRAGEHGPLQRARRKALGRPAAAVLQRGTRLADPGGAFSVRLEDSRLLGFELVQGAQRLQVDAVVAPDATLAARPLARTVQRYDAETGTWRSTAVQSDRYADQNGYPLLTERELLVQGPDGVHRLRLHLSASRPVERRDS